MKGYSALPCYLIQPIPHLTASSSSFGPKFFDGSPKGLLALKPPFSCLLIFNAQLSSGLRNGRNDLSHCFHPRLYTLRRFYLHAKSVSELTELIWRYVTILISQLRVSFFRLSCRSFDALKTQHSYTYKDRAISPLHC